MANARTPAEPSEPSPLELLPFPPGESLFVRLLWPLPPELEGDGVDRGTVRAGPNVLDEIRRRWGGGRFELIWKQPGHHNPAATAIVVVDGEPRELELASYSRNRRKRADAADMPPWAVMLYREVRELKAARGTQRDPTETTLALLTAAKTLFAQPAAPALGPEALSKAFYQGLELAKEMRVPSPAEDWPEKLIDRAPEILDKVRELRWAPRVVAGNRPGATGASYPLASASANVPPPAGLPPASQPAPSLLPEPVEALLVELRRAIADDDPTEHEFTASWIERYMPEPLVELLRRGGPDLAHELELLRPRIPELFEPRGQAFLERLLGELRAAPEGEETA